MQMVGTKRSRRLPWDQVRVFVAAVFGSEEANDVEFVPQAANRNNPNKTKIETFILLFILRSNNFFIGGVYAYSKNKRL